MNAITYTIPLASRLPMQSQCSLPVKHFASRNESKNCNRRAPKDPADFESIKMAFRSHLATSQNFPRRQRTDEVQVSSGNFAGKKVGLHHGYAQGKSKSRTHGLADRAHRGSEAADHAFACGDITVTCSVLQHSRIFTMDTICRRSQARRPVSLHLPESLLDSATVAYMP